MATVRMKCSPVCNSGQNLSLYVVAEEKERMALHTFTVRDGVKDG